MRFIHHVAEYYRLTMLYRLLRQLLMLLALVFLLATSACGEQDKGALSNVPTLDAGMATILAQPVLSTVVPSSVLVTTVSPELPTALAASTLPVLQPSATGHSPVLGQDTQTPSAGATAVTESVAAATAVPNATTAVPTATTYSEVLTASATASLPAPVEGPLPTSNQPPQPVPSATMKPAVQSTVPSVTTATTAVQPATPTQTGTPPSNAGLGDHFLSCVGRTGANASIVVPVDVVANNGGLTLAAGDEIAVFTPDDSLCVGVVIWTGQNVAITAWGDDSQTDALDGLREGEQMRFKIWRKATAQESIVQDVLFSLGDGIYATDSLHAVVALTVETN